MTPQHGRRCPIACLCGRGTALPEATGIDLMGSRRVPSPAEFDIPSDMPESLRWRLAEAAGEAARQAERYAEENQQAGAHAEARRARFEAEYCRNYRDALRCEQGT